MMGRTPEGERARTGARRQARYRARTGPGGDTRSVSVTPRKAPRAPGLSRRRDNAVALPAALQADYTRCLEALPEATRDTATGETLQAIADLDLNDILAIRPPRGFGRD